MKLDPVVPAANLELTCLGSPATLASRRLDEL